MIGQYTGLVACLKNQDGIDRNLFINYHCIIQQASLCAKSLRFDAVIKVINDVVKFIRAKVLNHRQFENFLTAEWEVNHGDVNYYCDVRWPSRVKILKRIAK